jgi:hypothetical protein
VSIFFLIIVLSFVVPAARRWYRNSQRARSQDPGMTGGFPGQFPGGFPGQQSNQPRDGFTQRDYYGGFGQLGTPQPPANQQYPGGQQHPSQQYPVPYEDSPEYLKNTPQAAPQPQWQSPGPPSSASAPGVPPAPSGPEGYRARKLAELDQKFSNGELAMEDYMAQRAEIMKG